MLLTELKLLLEMVAVLLTRFNPIEFARICGAVAATTAPSIVTVEPCSAEIPDVEPPGTIVSLAPVKFHVCTAVVLSTLTEPPGPTVSAKQRGLIKDVRKMEIDSWL
jgi:hypothetical protein